MTLQTCNTVFYNYIFKPKTPMNVSCQTQKKEMACGFTFKSLTFGINLRLPLKKKIKNWLRKSASSLLESNWIIFMIINLMFWWFMIFFVFTLQNVLWCFQINYNISLTFTSVKFDQLIILVTSTTNTTFHII